MGMLDVHADPLGLHRRVVPRGQPRSWCCAGSQQRRCARGCAGRRGQWPGSVRRGPRQAVAGYAADAQQRHQRQSADGGTDRRVPGQPGAAGSAAVWGGGAHSAALCSRCRPWWMRRVRLCGPLHRRRRLRAKLRRQRYPWTTRMPCLSAASPCVCARVYACPHRNGADDGGQAGAPSAHDVGRDGMADGSFLVG